jgi:predicted SAM-dependent methyltransferase
MPGFVNCDICPPADVIADLTETWPWPDSSVDEVFAGDIFEHLPDRIFTMNELWRVLKPGAIATLVIPSAVHGSGFAQDPTHVSLWCLNSFQYFDVAAYGYQRLAKHYGIKGGFTVRALSEAEYGDYREPVWKITAVLGAVK